MNSLVRSLRRLATKETGLDPDEHMLTSRCRSLCRMSLVDSNDDSLEDNDTTPGLRKSLRKEVIQPQVLLRLPCYDFTPVIDKSLDVCLLAVSSTSSAPVNSHGVTGGVYKARERIHRGVLIRDY